MFLARNSYKNCFLFSFEVDRLAKVLGMRLIKTSVKENLNVAKVNSPWTEDLSHSPYTRAMRIVLGPRYLNIYELVYPNFSKAYL